jgi:hypothetical protein
MAILLAGCSKKSPAPVAQAPSTQAAATSQGAQPPTGAAPEASSGPAAQANPEPVRAEVEIPRGVTLHVRLDEPVNTKRNRAGDSFRATLSSPVVVEGQTLLPVGTVFTGHVTDAEDSGRLKGRAVLALTLDGFRMDGAEHRIQTDRVVRQSESHKKRNIAFIGGGSGLGAAIGAIAGGGKGALIGAMAGGAAGTATDAATGKLEVSLPVESALSFSLRSPVSL